MLTKTNLAEKLALVREHWQPKIVEELNDSYVKIARLEGEFFWHHHEHEDELFFVIRGRLKILLRDGEITLGPGELVVVPRGVEHMPVAEEEVEILLIEPKSTLNSGNLRNERTVEHLERI